MRAVAGSSDRPDMRPHFEMQELFSSVRIPKIVVARDGTVLAFAKACRMLRRSEDGGKTWSPVQNVGSGASGNAIVDDNSGDVLIVGGRGCLWRSADSGKTWQREDTVLKPNAVGHVRNQAQLWLQRGAGACAPPGNGWKIPVAVQHTGQPRPFSREDDGVGELRRCEDLARETPRVRRTQRVLIAGGRQERYYLPAVRERHEEALRTHLCGAVQHGVAHGSAGLEDPIHGLGGRIHVCIS